MSNSTKTPKGTELPLMNLKGKPYLQVAHRLIWFREEEPQSGIETSALALNEEYAVFHAKITRDGKVVATATKRESKKDFPDFIEKAETGAIGRALALVGYGTQFTTQDLDEGDRLADSPIAPGKPSKAAPVEAKVGSTAASTVTDAPIANPTAASKSAPFFRPKANGAAKPASDGNVSQFD